MVILEIDKNKYTPEKIFIEINNIVLYYADSYIKINARNNDKSLGFFYQLSTFIFNAVYNSDRGVMDFNLGNIKFKLDYSNPTFRLTMLS